MEKKLPNQDMVTLVTEHSLTDKRLEKLEKLDYAIRSVCEATGTTSEASANLLIEELTMAMADSMQGVSISGNFELLRETALQDPLEAILVTQAMAAHAHAMEQFAKAGSSESPELEALHLKNAIHLVQVSGKHVERLNSYRKKGTQTIQVQHVSVNAGGQAIVGNIQNNKKGG